MNDVSAATRLKTLEDFHLMGALPEKKFDDIARLAAYLCKTPICWISLLDDRREFFISQFGFEIGEIPIERSFYPPSNQDKNNILEIRDTREEEGFKEHPFVTSKPHIVHYTGLPLIIDSGIRVGTICVIDKKARKLNEEQLSSLEVLAQQLVHLFELHKLETREMPGSGSERLTEIKDNEAQINNLTDNIPVGVFRYKCGSDGNEELLHVDEGAEKLWGIPSEITNENSHLVWDRYVGHGLHSHLRSIDKDEKRDKFRDQEWRYHHPDGTLRWHKATGSAVHHEDGTVVWDIIILDVSSQKITEEELKSTLELLKERAKEKDCLSNITQLANQSFDVENLLNEAVHLIPEGWQFSNICTAAITYDNITYQSEGHKSSPWTQTAQKLTFEGKPLNILVAYQEKQAKAWEGPFLKEERQLIEALADSLILSIDKKVAFKNQQLILQSTEEGIYGIDTKGYCTFINPAAAEMIGYNVRECLGKNMHDLIHYKHTDGTAYAESDCPIYMSRNKLEGCRIESEIFMRKDGSSFPVRYSSTPIIENGTIKGAVIVFNDITERINAEEQLKKSEQRFKALVQEGSDLISIVDAEGNYNYTSPLYKDYLDLSKTALEGKNAFDFVHPEDVEKLKKEFEALKVQKRIKSSPYRFMHKSKSWRWMQSMGTDLQDDETVKGIVINTVDITELIDTQKKLQASEARYRGFYESQTNFVIRTDMEGNYTYVNKKFMEDFGWLYPDGEVLGINSMPSIKEYHHPKVFEVVEECIAKPGKVVKVEIDKPTKDDGVVTTLWDFVCLLNADGHPSEMQCMGIDITERIRFERALKENIERFEKVTQATNDAIWDYDLVNDTLFWGKGFHTLFGHDPEDSDVSFEKLISLIHPEDRTEIAQKIEDFINNPANINWFAEYRFQRSDGSYALVIDRAIFIRNEKGEATRAVGAMTDISYRKKNEEALKKLNEELEKRARELAITNTELEQFAYVASHDLQEPLRMVSSFLTQLEKKYGDVLDDKARQYIHFAVDGAHRMRQIILDLLEYSKVGKLKEERRDISLTEVLDEVKKLFYRKIEKSNARIHYDELPVIKSYYTPLIQIFQNLISNSIKYTKQGETPEIHIKAQKQDDEWVISVQDNGIGIDPQYFEKIFVLFQRLHAKDKYEGTGMGLAIVKKNVEILGGRIWLKSGKGQGTTFYLAIPNIKK